MMISGALFLAERGYAPEALIRTGIRSMCKNRLSKVRSPNEYVRKKKLENFIDTMNRSEIALSPDMANQQHYELPYTFFEMILGSHRKYSCGYWEDEINDLDCSEQRALQLTCEHAGIRDGDQILELVASSPVSNQPHYCYLKFYVTEAVHNETCCRAWSK